MDSFGNVIIFGDSYSTFEGYIPEGYAVYYSPSAEYTDVNDVTDTWWHQVITESGSNLVLNNSWSGSTVCYMGYGGYQPEQSFALRAEKVFADGKITKPDTVFILGATNDSWNNSPVGSVKYSEWEDDDLRECVPAFCKLVSTVLSFAPGARIINIANEDFLKKEICLGMREACEHYGIEYIGIPGFDAKDGHPTKLGMKQIKEMILENT